MIKICIVSYCAYSLFNQARHTHIGGSEVRAWHFAKGLAERKNFKVSFVVADQGSRSPENFNNITLHHHPVFTITKFPKLSEKIHEDFFNSIDAQIFIIIGVHDNAYELQRYCKKNNKTFVLISGSDLDHSEIYLQSNSETNLYSSSIEWCRELLTQTKHLICQTENQKKLFKTRFNIDAFVIKNPVLPPSRIDTKHDQYGAHWVGRSDSVKQP